jgi:hypothetical protein
MFISKTHLDRRTFLRGMGATIALPLLDAMIPARTVLAATAAAPVPRLAFVYVPHGAVMREWTPDTAGPGPSAVEGPLGRLGRILEPFSAFADRLTIVSGLENRHAYGPVHAITPGTWLSGMSPREAGERLSTADQVAATHLGRHTRLASIQLATEPPRPITAGAWEGVFGDGFASTISFRESAPLPMAFDPRRVFDALFAHDGADGGRTTGMSAPASVLDLVAADTARLRKRLGAADRAILHGYLDTVRGVERRVDTAPAMSSTERTHLMFDMMALAFHADITRVASFMMAAETSQATYGETGVSDPFHALSHHQNDPEKIEKLVRIQSHHARMCAAFVRKLADLADGDGSLLDRSLVLYGSNMSDSHAHDHYPLPSALIGGACGRLRGGRHVQYPDRQPLSNLLLTMLGHAGVPVDAIGDSTGGCSEV